MNFMLRRLKQVMESRIFRLSVVALHLTNAVSFVLLLTSDCLHTWRLPLGGVRTGVVVALAVSSYLLWFLFSFLGVGILIFYRRSGTTEDKPFRKKYWQSRVRAVGLPVVYAIYFAWAAMSGEQPVPGLGALSVNAFLAYNMAYVLAMWADRRPRPPTPPRESPPQKAHRQRESVLECSLDAWTGRYAFNSRESL